MRDIVERIRLRERARDERLHETIMAKAISQLYLSLPAPTFILLDLRRGRRIAPKPAAPAGSDGTARTLDVSTLAERLDCLTGPGELYRPLG